jgi:hypothetical protein
MRDPTASWYAMLHILVKSSVVDGDWAEESCALGSMGNDTGLKLSNPYRRSVDSM